MEQPTTTAKVKLFIEEALQKSETKFIEQLERGDLHGFDTTEPWLRIIDIEGFK